LLSQMGDAAMLFAVGWTATALTGRWVPLWGCRANVSMHLVYEV
jgi:hypothetical protein